MEFNGQRQPDTQYIASISRGKDSNAMLHVIRDVLKWPLDGIYTVQVWATQDIPAELPPMTAWQDACDRKIEELFGLPVIKVCARDKDGNKISYEDIFYRVPQSRKNTGGGTEILGFPIRKGNWGQSELKHRPSEKIKSGGGNGIPIHGIPRRLVSPPQAGLYTDSPAISATERDGVKNSKKRYGFANRNKRYCNSRLKVEPKSRVFRYAPYIGRENKYGAVYRDRR